MTKFVKTAMRSLNLSKLAFKKGALLFLTIILILSSYSQPMITSFSPMSGPIGTNVLISGINFNPTPSNNVVFFGATKTTVDSCTSSNIYVSVPTGATYEFISVTNSSNHLTAYSANPFNVTFPPCGAFNDFSYAPHIQTPAGLTPIKVSASDFDGDGKPDILYTNNSETTISVLKNNSSTDSISFAQKIDFAAGQYPEDITISDFDGDGKPDFAITSTYNNTVSVYKNTSTIGVIDFAQKIDFIVDNQPIHVSSADLDRDGKPDLVITYRYTGNVSILRNTSMVGNITFAAKTDVGSGVAGDLSPCDLDGDAKPDLAITNVNNNTVSLFLNTSISGAISFTFISTCSTGATPRSISTCDLDGDGKSDIITANDGSPGSISVFKNKSTIGDISFSPKVDYPAGMGSQYLSSADLDGDGKPDVALLNFAENTVSVFINTSVLGNITFAQEINFNTGINPTSISISDFDGDEKPDFVISNQSSNTISILQNHICYGLSVNDLNNKIGLSVHPNPFSGSTTLQSDMMFNNAILTLYNSFGLKVMQIVNISGRTIVINRDFLPTGLYFLQLTEESKTRIIEKIIIAD